MLKVMHKLMNQGVNRMKYGVNINHFVEREENTFSNCMYDLLVWLKNIQKKVK